MADEQDYRLIALVAKGDSKSFESLFYKYQNLVYGYSMKMLKNKQKAEDITQETWMRVVRYAGSYKPTSTVKAWVMSIASNLVIDEFRKNKKFVDLEEEQWHQIEDVQQNLEEMFISQNNRSKMTQAFELLPENQKLVLSMILIEELSQSEASIRLGTTVGAVKAALFRARENLKKSLEVLND